MVTTCIPHSHIQVVYHSDQVHRSSMSREAIFKDKPYIDPNPLPSSIPSVDELGVTSAPLKTAAFFLGQFCKDVNGDTGSCAVR